MMSRFTLRFSAMRYAGLLSISLTLGACSLFGDAENIQKTVSGEPKMTFEAFRAKDPQAPLGAREHPKIVEANGGAYSNRSIERLIAPIAGALVTHSNDPERAYDITILDSPAINAFALPGGYLYVTRGLLGLANDESEVAAVLAHEIAHVASNHGIERSKQAKARTIAERVVNDVVTNELAGAKAKASAELKLASFSQTQELQADAVGIKMLARAGFDPFAAARLLTSMQRYSDWKSAIGSSDDDIRSSHPSTPRRIELARRHARSFGPPKGDPRKSGEKFRKRLSGMTFGDNAKQGFVRGRQFFHKALKISFSVPDGFDLTNKPEAVLASGPGETALRFDAVNAAKADPATYLKSGWVNGLDPASVTATTIGDFSAATGRAQAGQWQFHIHVVSARNRMFRFILAAPTANRNMDAVARQIANSFRGLSDREASGLSALKLSVVEVKPGDTIARLAARMDGVDGKVELFRALNGLAPGERPRPGTLVKLVTGG